MFILDYLARKLVDLINIIKYLNVVICAWHVLMSFANLLERIAYIICHFKIYY